MFYSSSMEIIQKQSIEIIQTPNTENIQKHSMEIIQKPGMETIQTPSIEILQKPNIPKRRLNVLSLAQKAKLLDEVEKNPELKKKDIALKYGIPQNTLSTILKNKQKILRSSSNIDQSFKKIRMCAYPDVEAALLKWFYNNKHKTTINGIVLKEKAIDFARMLNVAGFTASSGWLDGFKTRHKIMLRPLQRVDTHAEWQRKLPEILDSYSSADVFYLDETGLFYKHMPNDTAVFKNETCSKGEFSEERLTLAVGVNASGTEKLPLLVIGKSEFFCSLENVLYAANMNAWMTMALFEGYIRRLDLMFAKEKRKVLLFLDDSPAHCKVLNLEAIKLVFLPSEVTANIQTEEKITRSLKDAYRKLFFIKAMNNWQSEVKNTISVFDSIQLLYCAWDKIPKNVIRNCFRKLGFKLNDDEDSPVDISSELDIPDCIDWDGMSDYMAVDEHVLTCESLSDEAIVHSVLQKTEDNELTKNSNEKTDNKSVSRKTENKDVGKHFNKTTEKKSVCKKTENIDPSRKDIEEVVSPPPTYQQVEAAICVLQRFLECTESVDPSLFNCIKKVDKFVSQCKQKGIH